MLSQDILNSLPHGPAARLISEVVEHATGVLQVVKHWHENDAWINAHFSTGPHVVPGIFLAEQVAQSALLLGKLDGYMRPDQMYLLGSLRCDFLLPALAPCTVVSITRLTGVARGAMGFQGECLVDSQIVARVKGVAAPVPLTE